MRKSLRALAVTMALVALWAAACAGTSVQVDTPVAAAGGTAVGGVKPVALPVKGSADPVGAAPELAVVTETPVEVPASPVDVASTPELGRPAKPVERSGISEVEMPVAKPAPDGLPPRLVRKGRIQVLVAREWTEVASRSGALLAIQPLGDGNNRLIEIFRDPIEVAANLRAGAAKQYRDGLKLPEKSEGSVSEPSALGSDARAFEIVVSLAQPSARLQLHWLHYTDDGLYTVVVTTRAEFRAADQTVARGLWVDARPGSMSAAEQAAADQVAKAALSFTFGQPQGWMFGVREGVAELNLAVSGEKLPAAREGIRIKALSTAFPEGVAREGFMREFTEALKQQAGPNVAGSEVLSEAIGVMRGGHPSFVYTLDGPPFEAKGQCRVVTLVFGARSTFVVTLSVRQERKQAGVAGLEECFRLFSERD